MPRQSVTVLCASDYMIRNVVNHTHSIEEWESGPDFINVQPLRKLQRWQFHLGEIEQLELFNHEFQEVRITRGPENADPEGSDALVVDLIAGEQ